MTCTYLYCQFVGDPRRKTDFIFFRLHYSVEVCPANKSIENQSAWEVLSFAQWWLVPFRSMVHYSKECKSCTHYIGVQWVLITVLCQGNICPVKDRMINCNISSLHWAKNMVKIYWRAFVECKCSTASMSFYTTSDGCLWDSTLLQFKHVQSFVASNFRE